MPLKPGDAAPDFDLPTDDVTNKTGVKLAHITDGLSNTISYTGNSPGTGYLPTGQSDLLGDHFRWTALSCDGIPRGAHPVAGA